LKTLEKIKASKYNTLFTGILSGMVLPVIVYFVMYFSKVQDVKGTLFSNNLMISNFVPIVISHCVLPNLLLFFVFNAISWLSAAKGTLTTTVVLTAILFSIKLIFRFI
jgi:hypothetical protein